MIKYYTKEWHKAVVDLINASPKFAADAKKLNGTFVFRILDCPDRNDRMTIWTFKNGLCISHAYDSKPAPSADIREAPFDNNWILRATCPYPMMADLNKGEISPIRALASPKYKVEGKKMLVMQMMKAMNSWNEHAASVECTYEYSEE